MVTKIKFLTVSGRHSLFNERHWSIWPPLIKTVSSLSLFNPVFSLGFIKFLFGHSNQNQQPVNVWQWPSLKYPLAEKENSYLQGSVYHLLGKECHQGRRKEIRWVSKGTSNYSLRCLSYKADFLKGREPSKWISNFKKIQLHCSWNWIAVVK